MKEKLKGLRLNITVSAIFSIIVGILLLFYPTQSLVTIGRGIAAIVIIAGALTILSQVFENGFNTMGIVVGGILVLVGIWMFSSPAGIVSIIPIAIGMLLVAHGLQDINLAFEGLRAQAPHSWLTFLFAAVNIIFGIVCIAGAFNMVKIATQIIGIMLIYDGLSDMFIVHKVRKATSVVVDSTIISEEDL